MLYLDLKGTRNNGLYPNIKGLKTVGLGTLAVQVNPKIRRLNMDPNRRAYMYIYISIYLHIYIHIFLCLFIQLFVCLFIHVFTYSHIYIYLYIYTHTHTHTPWLVRTRHTGLLHIEGPVQ